MPSEYYTKMRALGPHPGWQLMPPAEHQDLLREADEGNEEHGRFDQPGDQTPQGHSIQYHGGPVLQESRLVVIWGGEKDLDKAKFALFCKDMMENGYFDALTPYLHNQQFKGTFFGAVEGPVITKTPFTQDDATSYVASCVASGLVPQPDGKTQYSIMLPPGIQADLQGEHSCGPLTPFTFCAYHFSPDGKTLIDVEADPTCGGCVGSNAQFDAACMLISHESCETIEDPFGSGWFEDKTGMEPSDIVAWIRLLFGPTAEGNSWAVQGYFGNENGGSNLVGKYRAPANQPPKYTLSISGPTNPSVGQSPVYSSTLTPHVDGLAYDWYENGILVGMLGRGETTVALPLSAPGALIMGCVAHLPDGTTVAAAQLSVQVGDAQPPPTAVTAHQVVINVDNQMLADFKAHKLTYAEALMVYTYLRQVFDQLPPDPTAPALELRHP